MQLLPFFDFQFPSFSILGFVFSSFHVFSSFYIFSSQFFCFRFQFPLRIFSSFRLLMFSCLFFLRFFSSSHVLLHFLPFVFSSTHIFGCSSYRPHLFVFPFVFVSSLIFIFSYILAFSSFRFLVFSCLLVYSYSRFLIFSSFRLLLFEKYTNKNYADVRFPPILSLSYHFFIYSSLFISSFWSSSFCFRSSFSSLLLFSYSRVFLFFLLFVFLSSSLFIF